MTTMDQWNRRTEIPLGGAAALFLVAYAWPIINPDLNGDIAKVYTLTTLVVWVLFVVDYVVRVGIADDRSHSVLHHIPDLLVIALPLLRPLRLLRLVALLHIMNRSAAGSLRGKVAVYVTGGGLMLVFVAALAVLDEERGQPGSNREPGGCPLVGADDGDDDRLRRPVPGHGPRAAGGRRSDGLRDRANRRGDGDVGVLSRRGGQRRPGGGLREVANPRGNCRTAP